MEADVSLLAEAKDDLKLLREVTHRIKGGAGTIGETNVHQRAVELEQCIQKRDGNFGKLFNDLVNTITKSIEQTKAWINEQ